jgi:hypothetical protein
MLVLLMLESYNLDVSDTMNFQIELHENQCGSVITLPFVVGRHAHICTHALTRRY